MLIKAEEGEKKMIFGKPYHYTGGKWHPDFKTKEKGQGEEKEGKEEKEKKWSVTQVDKYLKENGLEHLPLLDVQILKRLMKSKGFSYAHKNPEQMCKELEKVYGKINDTPEKPPKEPAKEKPKEEPKVEPTPKEEPKPKKEFAKVPPWKPITGDDPNEWFNQFADNFAKMGVKLQLKVSPRVRKDRLDGMGSYLTDALNRSKKFREIMSNPNENGVELVASAGPVVGFEHYTRAEGNSGISHGLYRRDDIRRNISIIIPEGEEWRAKDNPLMLGYQHNIGESNYRSCLIHELGHHCFYEDEEVRLNFLRLYNNLVSKGIAINARLKGVNPITTYSGTNFVECFAECFSAFFHPDYQRDPKKGEYQDRDMRKRLPKEIHEFFVKYFGDE